MGQYTEYLLDVELKADTPTVLTDYLKWLIEKAFYAEYWEGPAVLPEHEALKNDRLRFVMCDFVRDKKWPRALTKKDDGKWHLQAAGNMKNYAEGDYSEGTAWQPIQGLLDLVRPWIDMPADSDVGFYEYEEWHEQKRIVWLGDKYNDYDVSPNVMEDPYW